MNHIFNILLLSLPAFLFAQDVLTLRNGNEIRAKVQEVGIKEIKYLNYDNMNGPVYIISKNEVAVIKYENGTTETFEFVPEVKPKNTNIESFERYDKRRKVGIGLLVPGGVLLTGGVVFFSMANTASANGQYVGVYASFITWGIAACGASVPLHIIGGVQLRKYSKYKKLDEQRRKGLSLNLTPAGLQLRF